MKEKYDVIFVGAGPSAVFAALELIETNPKIRILMIDSGKRVEDRDCPANKTGKCVKCAVCCVTHGFAGAGANSDGKLSLYNDEDDDIYVGGVLHKYIGVDKCKELIDYTDKIYLRFGADTKLEGIGNDSQIEKVRRRAISSNLTLINIPIRHLGTERSRKLYQKIEEYLESKNVEIIFDSNVCDLIIDTNSNTVSGVKYSNENSEIVEVYASNVVLAVGRAGANNLLGLCEKHNIKTSPGAVDIGIRYELPNKIMENINKYFYEAKIFGYVKPFDDKVRTFCQNPGGFVTVEGYEDDVTLANGHSLKVEKSENTNLALLVTLKLKGMKNPMDYSINIAKNINALANGNVIVQRLEDIRAGKRTWPEELEKNPVKATLNAATPGDLSLGFPYRIMMDILSFIDSMDKVVPGFADGANLLYGPEIKFYSNKVKLSRELETSIKNLYAIGDGCGLTRGLMMASASGVWLGKVLAKKI